MNIQEIIEQAKDLHRHGDLEKAEKLYREILEKVPTDPDANHLLGTVFHQRGENVPALELIRKSMAVREDHPPSYNNLGMVFKELGRDDDAIEAFRRAIELQPDFAEAYNNLGTVYQRVGRVEESWRMYNQAVILVPNYVKALNNLGSLYRQRGEFSTAFKWYGRALSVDPEHPLTHYNLGCALLDRGRLDEAEAAFLQVLVQEKDHFLALRQLGTLYQTRYEFHKALDMQQRAKALQPESAEVYMHLARTFSEMNWFEEAKHNYEHALSLDPESAEVHINLGLLYNQMGHIDKAQESLDKAETLRPKSPHVHTAQATLAMNRGEFAESVRRCRKALSLNPDFAPAYYQLAQIVSETDVESTIEKIEELLQKKTRTVPYSVLLHFALAQLYEKKEEYADASENLVKANDLKRGTIRYSLDFQQKTVEGIIDVFSRETIHRLDGKGYASTVPLFIVGMPRSGTTLIEQILASHPEVYGAGELALFAETVAAYAEISRGDDNSLPPETLSLVAEDLANVGRNYVDKLRKHAPSSPFITNKMPGNFLHLGLISLALPEAKIIHLNRDPMDNCLSIYKKLFAHGHQYAYNPEWLGEYYHLYLQLMEHWRRVLPGRFFDLCYEKLVRDQDGETRRLLDYCGLGWHDDCLRFYEHQRPVFTASSVQVRQPLTNRSIGLWKKYENILLPLTRFLEQG